MDYLKPSFTVPAGSAKISDEDWNRIFSKKEEKAPEEVEAHKCPNLCQDCSCAKPA